MKTLGLLGSTLIGMLAVSTTTLKADSYFPSVPTENLSIALTALVQGETTELFRGKGPDREPIGEKIKIPIKVKINNKSILKLLRAPSGSKLVLTDGNVVSRQIGNAAPVETGYALQVDTGAIVIVNGQEIEVDTSNASQERSVEKFNQHAVSVATAAMSPEGAVPGLFFSLTGSAAEQSIRSEVRKGARVKSSEAHSFQLDGVGEGTVVTDDDEELDALLSGTITSSGKTSEAL